MERVALLRPRAEPLRQAGAISSHPVSYKAPGPVVAVARWRRKMGRRFSLGREDATGVLAGRLVIASPAPARRSQLEGGVARIRALARMGFAFFVIRPSPVIP